MEDYYKVNIRRTTDTNICFTGDIFGLKEFLKKSPQKKEVARCFCVDNIFMEVLTTQIKKGQSGYEYGYAGKNVLECVFEFMQMETAIQTLEIPRVPTARYSNLIDVYIVLKLLGDSEEVRRDIKYLVTDANMLVPKREWFRMLSKHSDRLSAGSVLVSISSGWTTGIDELKIVKGHSTSLLSEKILYVDDNIAISCNITNNNFSQDKDVVIMLLDSGLVYDSEIEATMVQDNEVITIASKTFKRLVLGTNCTLIVGSDELTITGKGGHPAIEASGKIYIGGKGKLILNSGSHAGCIGEPTNYPMSYNRWAGPETQKLFKIFISGEVEVVCNTEIPNFALGGFAKDWIPEIILSKGGSIVTPDVKDGFERVMASSGEHYSGSTKRTGLPVYEMIRKKCYITNEF